MTTTTEQTCTDDHSAAKVGGPPCPVHGYDGSVPPPYGWSWYEVPRADGQIYTALVLNPLDQET